jgi:hypothetical protein
MQALIMWHLSRLSKTVGHFTGNKTLDITQKERIKLDNVLHVCV